MLKKKCKKSVFCAFFMSCFLIGTICGVLLFHIFHRANQDRVYAYGAAIFSSYPSLTADNLLLFFFPFVFLCLLCLFPFGWRIYPLITVGRGCLASYFFSFASVSGVSTASYFVRELFSLCLFYFLCRWCYYASGHKVQNSSERFRYVRNC